MRRKLYLLLALLGLAACGDTPFDPAIGPRNPIPGAQAYLETVRDISAADKTALLEWQPVEADVLRRLVEAPSVEMRAVVAGNRAAPPDALEALAADENVGVRQYAAMNANLPRASLLALRRDPQRLVREATLRNPNWSADELREFYAAGTAPAIYFASNPSTPADVLLDLARTGDSLARMNVAANTAASSNVLEVLAQDSDPLVRRNVAWNRATPEDLVLRLAGDAHESVRRAAAIGLRERGQTP